MGVMIAKAMFGQEMPSNYGSLHGPKCNRMELTDPTVSRQPAHANRRVRPIGVVEEYRHNGRRPDE